MKKDRGLFRPKYKDKLSEQQRQSEIWWISYSVCGKIFRESAGTKSKTEAKKLLDLRRGAAAEGKRIIPRADRILIDELLQDVLTDYEVNGRRSLDTIRLIKDKHLIPYFGGRPARSITSTQIQEFILNRQKNGTKAATINRSLSLLRRAYILGQRSGKITTRPHVELLKENNVRAGFFEHHQLELLCTFLPDDIEAVVRFAYITGWRIPSEVMTLEWRNIDFKNKEVTLDAGVTKNDEPRVFPMTSELEKILLNQRAKANVAQKQNDTIVRYVFFRTGTPGLPFVSQKSKTSHYYRDAWTSAIKQAGLMGKIPHDFRRTAIRNFSNSGISEQIGMKLAGHKTASIYRRYRIVNREDLRNAVKKLESLHNTAKSLQSRT